MAEPSNSGPDAQSSPGQVPLDYAPPAVARPTLHMCVGAVATATVILPLTVVGALFGSLVGVVIAPLFAIAIAAVVASRLRRSQRTRAWAAGIWIGIGAAVLLNGLCWAVLSGVRFGG
jgi:hypothetical protein